MGKGKGKKTGKGKGKKKGGGKKKKKKVLLGEDILKQGMGRETRDA